MLPATPKNDQIDAPRGTVLIPAEVAELLRVNLNELYPRLQDGTLPFPVRRVGRRWLIPARPLYAWLEGDSGQSDAV